MESNDADVTAFVERVASPVRRRDAQTLLALYERITGQPPRMWGPSIVGFGEYHYEYASGTSGDASAAAFSPRKASTTVYLPDGVEGYAAQLEKLGDHSTGVSCLYLKNLEAVDMAVLEAILKESYRRVSSDGFGRPAASD